jgi:hypothetical protein
MKQRKPMTTDKFKAAVGGVDKQALKPKPKPIMPEITIDKGVPISARRGGSGRNPAWPFEQMKIGDSFAVPLEFRKRAQGAASAHKRNHPGFNFVMRSNDHEVRIWRIVRK